MKYFLARGEIVDSIADLTKLHFQEKNVDISNIKYDLYHQFYLGLLIGSLEAFSSWTKIDSKLINKELPTIYYNKRNTIDSNIKFGDVETGYDFFELAVARFKILLEKSSSLVQYTEEQKEEITEYLMESYYCDVLDYFDMQIKSTIKDIVKDNSWCVFDVVYCSRYTQLINYGDFRVLSWERMIQEK